jgi:hypothetical protein
MSELKTLQRYNVNGSSPFSLVKDDNGKFCYAHEVAVLESELKDAKARADSFGRPNRDEREKSARVVQWRAVSLRDSSSSELKASEAADRYKRRAEALACWAERVAGSAARRPYPGAREECVFCDSLRGEHPKECPMSAFSDLVHEIGIFEGDD